MSRHRETNALRRLRRSAIRALLLGVMVLPIAGCAMFQPPPREQPDTVSEWMKQPRVGEAPAAENE